MEKHNILSKDFCTCWAIWAVCCWLAGQPLLDRLQEKMRWLPLPRGGAGGPLAGGRGRLLCLSARGGAGGLLVLGVGVRLPWRSALSYGYGYVEPVRMLLAKLPHELKVEKSRNIHELIHFHIKLISTQTFNITNFLL